MAVLELLLLRLRPGISPTDPSLVQNLSTVRSFIHTNSRFYHCIEDPSLIYILGQWPTLAAHQVFLASPEREQILSHQTGQLDFQWMLHLNLPDSESVEAVLPLTAPVLGIARMTFTASGPRVRAFQTVLNNHRSEIVDGTSPYPAFDGWGVDAPEGTAEYVMLTGWASVEAHAQFTKSMGQTSKEYASVRDRVDGMEVRHARNMEA